MAKMLRSLAFIIAGAWVSAYADTAPVVDLSQTNNSPMPAAANPAPMPDPLQALQAMPLDQRVTLLEKQMANFTQMNLPGKIDDIQQQIQQLSGQLEVQAHNIQSLNDQQRNFYQDLDQRLNELKAIVTNASVTTTKAAKAKLSSDDASTTTSSPSSADEETSYQNAFNLLAKQQNAKAITAFQAYLKSYPKGKYAANSHYWLGELYSMQNKNELASNEFNTVISKFPNNPKISDAMLKLAVIHDKAGKKDQAKKELQQIIKQFPGSSAARLANMRLEQMKLQTTASS